jgi:hypothetical protein
MVSGHFYLGDKKKAMEFCESAKKNTVDQMFLTYIDNLVNDIKAGKEIFK